MNTAVNANVVHESEAQRQHARVKVPAKLRLLNGEQNAPLVRVEDLSAGGLSFVAPSNVKMTEGEVIKGRLQFLIDNLGLAMDVEMQVRSISSSGRIGCQFQNLEAQDIATLRHIITSHLSGDIVSMGEVLATLQRDNFTKARKNKKETTGMSALGRLRAVTFSLGIFIVGLAAFGFIFKTVYGLYFVSHASAGLVSVPSMDVTMPREGTVQSLVQVNGDAAKGAPLATFNTSMLEMLKGSLTGEDLQPAKIEELYGKQMSGTMTSPCDCVVVRQLVADGQFASKGQVIFQLVPRNAPATVEARFTYRQFNDVKPGTPVSFQIAGEDQLRTGKIISSSNLSNTDLSTDIRVQIQPDESLSSSLAGRPVEVVSDRGPSVNWLIDKAMAAGL
ncbi:alginate biosynthesis protein Alg44 [Pseudomonas cichorii]|uniref:Alginate biosynthesis protein Alg44 n=2 Tax=Pseudomonas syringae group TaxID=136849 RepID=A0A3M4VGI7_PSECI|nr:MULTISPECIES: alginate biosynthesis protein Alg44 [Pseudomonas syringae group]AHF66164.1 alginate biosynthesis protein Alg44 [Pseudomonas cichorii JBC1]MBX8490237.1 alginate biosynthesis protein Alg44 [Pseudomonas cichorii]MBX8498725.1 alginate biosynthesis protein Alg44 [Pseudomonas lijiangensis]MBX8504405.1 alginate biosynthesis protein Alg44 [Pseudomonas lijiangensis]MBX8508877.1 alginate biosynthesis protein Alg44 [Pseudomonas cichorii]